MIAPKVLRSLEIVSSEPNEVTIMVAKTNTLLKLEGMFAVAILQLLQNKSIPEVFLRLKEEFPEHSDDELLSELKNLLVLLNSLELNP